MRDWCQLKSDTTDEATQNGRLASENGGRKVVVVGVSMQRVCVGSRGNSTLSFKVQPPLKDESQTRREKKRQTRETGEMLGLSSQKEGGFGLSGVCARGRWEGGGEGWLREREKTQKTQEEDSGRGRQGAKEEKRCQVGVRLREFQ
jgi:hypothetical protein